MDEKVVAVSGYFDPLHVGHLMMIQEAARYGKVLVIVNNMEQTINKKGYQFMPSHERAAIMEALGDVDRAVISIDEDETVCRTLELWKPDMFCNGGDRFKDNVPEKKICKKLGIKMIFNVGGEKIQSSSEMVRKAQSKEMGVKEQ